MQAIRNNVIVQTIELESTTQSGIVISGDSGEQTYARVIACGEQATDVQPGDQVLVDWRHARGFKFGNEQYYTIDQNNILAVCEDV